MYFILDLIRFIKFFFVIFIELKMEYLLLIFILKMLVI